MNKSSAPVSPGISPKPYIKSRKSVIGKTAVLIACLIVILIIKGANIVISPDPFYDYSDEPIELYRYLFLTGAIGLMGILILFLAKIRLMIKSCWPIYAAVIALPVCALLSSLQNDVYHSNLRWLTFGSVSIYLPALFSLLILPAVYMTVKFQKITAANGLWIFLLCGVIPFTLAYWINGTGRMVVLLFAFLIFVLKLWREGKLSRNARWAFSGAVILSVAASAALLLASPDFLSRLEVVFSRGQSDPYGRGYPLVLLEQTLDQIRWIGAAEGTLLYEEFSVVNFFSKAGYSLLPTAMNLGWAGTILLAACILTLSGVLYAMSRSAANPFAGYFIFCCAVFFLLRFVFAAVYEFTMICFWESPPFMGNTFTLVIDSLLLFLSLALYIEDAPSSVVDACIPCRVPEDDTPAYDSPVDWLLRRIRNILVPLQKHLYFSPIELTDSSGQTHDFELLDMIVFRGKSYAVLTDACDGADDPCDVFIFEIKDSKEDHTEEIYVSVEDPQTMQAVFETFLRKSIADREFVLRDRFIPTQVKKPDSEPKNKNEIPQKENTYGFTLKPYSGPERYIFISYSHDDKREVMRIVRRMQLDGYRIWYDEGIDPGSEYNENIAMHILQSGYFIAFLSQNYLGSEYCKDEVNFARKHGKRILRIYLEDVPLPPGMDMRLDRSQAIHRYTYTAPEDFWEKLYKASGIHEFQKL